jgi:hypothetical protein
LPPYLDKVDILARSLIDGIKYDDRDRHWRSKRAGNWGFIHGIENRIADKIFPTVEQILNEYIVHLNNYSSSIKIELDHLQKKIQEIEQKNQLAGIKPLSLAACQQNLVGKIVNKTYVENCKSSIIRDLNDFINHSKLKEVKECVSDVVGKGTNATQNYEISNYYNELQQDICQKLQGYLNEIIQKFAESLFEQAEGIKPKIEQALMAELDAKESDIATKLSLSVSGEKKKVLQHISVLKNLCLNINSGINTSNPSAIENSKSVVKFPSGGKDMQDDFPIRLTLAETRSHIVNLENYPLIIEKLEQAIRTQEDGVCWIGLSLELEITKLLKDK